MSATLEEPQIELSPESLKDIERAAVAAVTHLMESAVSDLREMMRQAQANVGNAMQVHLEKQKSGEISIARDIHQHFPE